MAMAAGKIQADFRQDLIFLGKLAYLGWIDLYLVRSEITREYFGISPCRLDQIRHVTLYTGEL